nr:AAA family ATPase [Marispirochaeta sp.]
MLKSSIAEKLKTDKRIVVLFGPRQVGKTTLACEIMNELSGEDPRTSEAISSCDLARLRDVLSGYEYVLLDEAQYIPNVAHALKIFYDSQDSANTPVHILLTGSSSLSLAGGTREPLTGSTWSYTLYPISFSEILQKDNYFEAEARLDDALVLGLYPALFSLPNRKDRVQHLRELSSAYRDVLELGGIKNPKKLMDLLRLLAYQIGSEVSYSEIGQQCGLSAKPTRMPCLLR